VLGSLAFLALRMSFNRNTGFAPYPFIPLSLVLSCVAAPQGAILLIAARRADQMSAELAVHDHTTNAEALEAIHRLEVITAGIKSLLECPLQVVDHHPSPRRYSRSVSVASARMAAPYAGRARKAPRFDTRVPPEMISWITRLA
jgi:uncharacterized membrane protein